jgi:ceramide glucosyltransferase
MTAVSLALLVITCAGAAYLAVAMLHLVAFALRKPAFADNEFAPSVTVLKPVAGLEPRLYENLASFCDQAYPDFDVVFCLHSGTDPALTEVERVVRDFPGVRTRIALGHNDAMANPKVANLAKPEAAPNGDIVVIADSDVVVGRDYLRAIAGEFATERVGAVTCLYGALPNDMLASRLGALHVEDEFAPSVLVALALGPLRFCLGATMAVRRSILDRIGGLEVLGSYLADDYMLGSLVARSGHAIALAPYPVKTLVTETELTQLWSHELRWARTQRAQAPAGYFFSFVTFALPFALIYALVARGSVLALPVLAAVCALRLGVHVAARRALRIRRTSDWLLIPLRDVLSLAEWCVSLGGRTVRWRDLHATVSETGRLRRE